MPHLSPFVCPRQRTLIALLPLLLMPLLLAPATLPAARSNPLQADAFDPLRLADEARDIYLFGELDNWFPRALDMERGGFHASFARDWSRRDESARSLTFQARMIWTAATVARHYPDRREEYLRYVRHGVEHLRETFRDAEQGGFYWERDLEGGPGPTHGDDKHAYPTSFAIYALAAAHAVAPDLGALELATEAFLWFDGHAHDAEHGGYFEQLARDGTPVVETPEHLPPQERIGGVGTMLGYKSMNSHIHLLEAWTELYHVWPDPRLRERLEELFLIVRDRIYVEPGALNLFFTRDWRPLPDHNSVGHDVETAYLLIEAAEALGLEEDRHTWHVARRLVDHALDFGWDNEHGGFYYRTGVFGGIFTDDKQWWVQAEGLNALLLMHERFGGETDRYRDAFLKMWRFIENHQFDHEHGGWFGSVSPSGEEIRSDSKGHPWKAAYHTGRSMIEVEHRLRRLAGQPPEGAGESPQGK